MFATALCPCGSGHAQLLSAYDEDKVKREFRDTHTHTDANYSPRYLSVMRISGYAWLSLPAERT